MRCRVAFFEPARGMCGYIENDSVLENRLVTLPPTCFERIENVFELLKE